MKTSDKGIVLIKSFEGCRLQAYMCPSGIWTIGYGHTAGVSKGQIITQVQADAFLKSDLEKYEGYVKATGLILNQNQFDALVSFTYNCGNGNLKKLIKGRTLGEIAEALLLYTKSNGKVLNGLVRRRKVERDLFLEPAEEKKGDIEQMIIIHAYSKTKDGNKKLSDNFRVKEFACNDGSDVIFVAPELVEVLQSIRNHFGKAVNINSGYRTPSYNKNVDGATYSQHLYGTAADIRVNGVAPREIAEYAETLLPDRGGIGIYSNFVHVDVRKDKSRWNG